MINREEKWLYHVAMMAKFLDDNKPKRHLKSGFALFQTSSILFNFIQFVTREGHMSCSIASGLRVLFPSLATRNEELTSYGWRHQKLFQTGREKVD